jgi:outer membrane protein
MTSRPARVGALLCAAFAVDAAGAQPAFENRLSGEFGLGAFATGGIVHDSGAAARVLPYAYGDFGRLFARIDTFGVKTLPIGWGHLELVARVSIEGFDADTAALRGLRDRDNPKPLGVGTFQRTPAGAFFVYAMHDLESGGAFVEATWAGRFEAGGWSVYPLLGIEYRGAAYVRHLYGVDAAESAASGLAEYGGRASTVPMAGLAATVPIAGPWALQLQWRHRWLDGAITASPIVTTHSWHSGHVALTYAFR